MVNNNSILLNLKPSHAAMFHRKIKCQLFPRPDGQCTGEHGTENHRRYRQTTTIIIICGCRTTLYSSLDKPRFASIRNSALSITNNTPTNLDRSARQIENIRHRRLPLQFHPTSWNGIWLPILVLAMPTEFYIFTCPFTELGIFPLPYFGLFFIFVSQTLLRGIFIIYPPPSSRLRTGSATTFLVKYSRVGA